MTPSSCVSFEHLFVHDVYDDIAGHFSCTRFTIWPLVTRFLSALSPFSLVSDVGCGNGKNLIASSSDHIAVGCDISMELCSLARDSIVERDKICDIFHADGLYTGFKPNIFDATLSIAVIHHFSSSQRRLQAIQELYRITKPGGKVLISVWAYGQPKMSKWTPIQIIESRYSPCCASDTQDFIVPWHLRKDFAKKEKVDLFKKDPRGDLIYGRYYYLFKENELDELVQDCGFKIEQSYLECHNYVVVGVK
ncbi:hypothetical protein GEMRC1_008557 [Eukaryota sp. GEM-RC1]